MQSEPINSYLSQTVVIREVTTLILDLSFEHFNLTYILYGFCDSENIVVWDGTCTVGKQLETLSDVDPDLESHII